MTYRIRFSDQARADLGEVWDYLSEVSEKAADQKVDRITATCQLFADTPELGRRREEFRPGVRSFPIDNHLIFYRVGPERVDILRILHGARKLEDLLTPEQEETFDQDSSR